MKSLIVIMSILFGWTLLSQSSCAPHKSAELQKEGDQIVGKIQAFEQKENRLPDSLTELGIEEKLEGPIFYRKISDQRYDYGMVRNLANPQRTIQKKGLGKHAIDCVEKGETRVIHENLSRVNRTSTGGRFRPWKGPEFG